jgi:hypothetical protein
MCGWRRLRNLFGRTQSKRSPEVERDSPRVNASLFVSLENNSAVLETLGNVGLGGFCYAASEPLEPGTRLDVMVDLRELNRWLIARGEVLGSYLKGGHVWVRGRFAEIDFEDERWLARWLDGHNLIAA